MLSGKKILLGVTGSIAAYKSSFLVRLLVKAGAEVRVVLTPSARDFVTPLTLSTLSKNPVLWDYFDRDSPTGEWHRHVELALWADLMIIAPATANILGKMAQGIADNFLLAVYMSAKCPIYIAPAMDLDMYAHRGTQDNLQKLSAMGHRILEAESGELASGLSGQGRMAEPENILAYLREDLLQRTPWRGKNVLITAGPTQEPIDPVRYIGNRSSGKMGWALAQAALDKGAQVHLVIGPNALNIQKQERLTVYPVQTASEMYERCLSLWPNCQLGILSAAVADYRPAKPNTSKIKKEQAKGLQIDLVENPDILKTLGLQKGEQQKLVGFALETDNAEENAWAKLKRKNCDAIVLNQPSSDGTGFGHDTNAVTILYGENEKRTTALKSKNEIALEILDFLHERYYSQSAI